MKGSSIVLTAAPRWKSPNFEDVVQKLCVWSEIARIIVIFIWPFVLVVALAELPARKF